MSSLCRECVDIDGYRVLFLLEMYEKVKVDTQEVSKLRMETPYI